jgi:putative hydrolase of HD superfamily
MIHAWADVAPAASLGGRDEGDRLMRDTAEQILKFLALSERLKRELRHSWLSDGRRESVAEHCWQMALMALLAHRHLAAPVDIGLTLKMILVHDLVEAVCGDVPWFETGERKELKAQREREAIEVIRGMLPEETGAELRDLWLKFEDGLTPEAKFAKALDNLEVQIQHNLAELATWTPVEHGMVYTKMDRHCAHDPFLAALCEAVRAQAEAKMIAGGVDVAAVTAAS